MRGYRFALRVLAHREEELGERRVTRYIWVFAVVNEEVTEKVV